MGTEEMKTAQHDVSFKSLRSLGQTLLLALPLALSSAFSLAPTTAAAQPLVVAELFTSQGCSSCPPADEVLAELANEENVLALSIHVDYWDYLGWKDKLAQREFSDRQRSYANNRGDRMVYTPQLVINGREHLIGNHKDEVDAALKRAPAMTATVEISSNDMGIKAIVDGTLPTHAKMATVFLASVSDKKTAKVLRGENTGKTLTYVNVVNEIRPIGMWSGGKATFSMPKRELMKHRTNQCVILIQLESDDGPGRIIGASALNWGKDKS